MSLSPREAMKWHALLTLDECGGVEDANGFAVDMLRQRCNFYNAPNVFPTLSRALKELREAQYIIQDLQGTRTFAIEVAPQAAIDGIRGKKEELLKVLEKAGWLKPQVQLELPELEVVVKAGFVAIVEAAYKAGEKEGHLLYRIDPRDILENSGIDTSLITTVLNYLSGLGLVAPSPYHNGGLWKVRVDKEVYRHGLEKVYRRMQSR